MLTIRRATDRGHAHHNWMDCRYSFTADNDLNSRYPSFRALHAINEIKLMPQGGFAPHRHQDTEIVNYVFDGALENTDGGNRATIVKPGELQIIGAGKGITHSERNPSRHKPLHYLEIHIDPKQHGFEACYQRDVFSREAARGRWLLSASGRAQGHQLRIRQDVELNITIFDSDDGPLTYDLKRGRHAWLHVARGAVTLNGIPFKSGDGVAVSDPQTLQITARPVAEVLLFDLG